MYRASFHYVFVRILHVSCNLSCSFPAYDTCDHTLSSVFIAVENFPKMSQLKQKRKGIICSTLLSGYLGKSGHLPRLYVKYYLVRRSDTYRTKGCAEAANSTPHSPHPIKSERTDHRIQNTTIYVPPHLSTCRFIQFCLIELCFDRRHVNLDSIFLGGYNSRTRRNSKTRTFTPFVRTLESYKFWNYCIENQNFGTYPNQSNLT